MKTSKKLLQICSGPFRRENGERGSSLILVMIMMVTMVTMAMGAIKITQLNISSSGAHKKGKQAFYSAEVGLDVAVNDIIQKFENLSVYTTTENDGGDPGKSVDYRGHDVYYTVTNPLDRFLYQTVAGNSTIYHYAHTFNIEAISTSRSDNSKEHVRESIRILETPLVQYYIFYGGTGNDADLEILPGPAMNSWGRIHANGDIYIGANASFTLRNYNNAGAFTPHLISAGGHILAERKDRTAVYNPTRVEIKIDDSTTPVSTPSRTMPVGGINDANEIDEERDFNNYVLVNEQKYSAPGREQFFRNGFYEQRSIDPLNPRIDTMRIVGTGAGMQFWVSRPALENVTLEVQALTTPFIRETADTDTLCEDREGDRWVDWTDIDLDLLGEWYIAHLTAEGLDWAEDGMLIYTSRSPTGAPYANKDTRLQAIRLISIGGSTAELHTNTTLATDNPIYIQGNFNSDGTRRGVALVGDAINILSTGFSSKDCDIDVEVDAIATETTVNAAFFGGNVPTPAAGGDYSGGLENYPRFHEDWSGVNCHIEGSFINLWKSFQADGSWKRDSGVNHRYRAPNREWGWDVNFENPNFWPPFIPSIFSVERVGFLEG